MIIKYTSVAAAVLGWALSQSASVFANTHYGDLLQSEQWGLNNSGQPTCAQRPDIDTTTNPATYQCNERTENGAVDVDINAQEAWTLFENAFAGSASPNQEVVLALIDTGIDYSHPDLANKIWLNPGEATGLDNNQNGIDDGCEDNIDGDGNGYLNDCHGASTLVPRTLENGALNPLAGDPMDNAAGHGTNMAAIMIGEADNQSSIWHGGIAGVAGAASNIKIATCAAAQLESDVFPLVPGITIPVAKERAVVDCIWYFYNLKLAGVNIAVINSSGGMSKHVNFNHLMYPLVRESYWLNSPEMVLLMDLLQSADIVVAAAAGNNSWSIDQVTHERAYYPASYTHPNVIGVTGITQLGDLWSGSSYGRWSVDIAAPGYNIVSAVPRAPLFPEAQSDFITTHGTSQSTAFVSGAVGLIRAYPGTSHLDASAIRRLLLSSGMPLPDLTNNTVSGALIRLADSNGRGALTCNDQVFRRRSQPASDHLIALPGSTVKFEVEHYRCSDVVTEPSIAVTIMPGNMTVSLFDNGAGVDAMAADGIYSGEWTVPYGAFAYTATSGWDSVTQSTDQLQIQASIIVDNHQQTDWTGKWWSSVYRSGFYGHSYRYATPNDPEKIFTWSPAVEQTGRYEVFARWPDGPHFATNALFRIHHSSESNSTLLVTELTQNQTGNGGQWQSLGVYWLPSGTQTIQLSNLNADGTVIADAIQLVPIP